MPNSPDDLAVLSALSLEWHHAATDISPDCFQTWALGRLGSRIPFDGAFWASGHWEGRRPVFHNFILVNRPLEMRADYARIYADDWLGAKCAASPGTAYVANAMRDDPATTPRVAAYLKKWKTTHALSCHTVDNVTGLSRAISLWRETEKGPFDESCRRFFELAMVHLNDAMASNCIHHLGHGLRRPNPRFSGAVADRHGILQLTTPAFQQWLTAEWPDWRGPWLPDPLKNIFGEPPRERYVGARSVFLATPVNDLIFLQARARTAADSLSKREREIAELVLQGLTRQQIAGRLGSAPSTVRNHLSTVFLKLGIHKQSELATKMLGDD